MPRVEFPDPRSADDDGLLAVGGNLEVDTLLQAYRQGIFPWPAEGYPLLWFSPRERAILPIERLHVSRSLRRSMRRFEWTIDHAFERVVRHCASVPRRGEAGTWILPPMIEAYVELHRQGHAHSVEVWREGDLVGGIYGVDAGGAFSAESMFHLESDASKVALVRLAEHLAGRGLDWIDVQVMTPHLASMGATSIDRDRFLASLERELRKGRRLFD